MSNVGEKWEEAFKDDRNVYRASASKGFFYIFRNTRSFRMIKKNVKISPRIKVLEPGCASGKMSVALALCGCDVTALDYSPKMINAAKNLKRDTEKIYNKKLNLEVVKGDLTNLDFEDGTFDLVINEGVVEHWLDKDERISVLKQMIRVTKNRGKVIIIVPNGGHPLNKKWTKEGKYDTPPMTNYSIKRLKKELELAGLKNIKTDGLGPWYSFDIKNKYLAYIPRVLNLIIPLPKETREKWGLNIIAIGEK